MFIKKFLILHGPELSNGRGFVQFFHDKFSGIKRDNATTKTFDIICSVDEILDNLKGDKDIKLIYSYYLNDLSDEFIERYKQDIDFVYNGEFPGNIKRFSRQYMSTEAAINYIERKYSPSQNDIIIKCRSDYVIPCLSNFNINSDSIKFIFCNFNRKVYPGFSDFLFIGKISNIKRFVNGCKISTMGLNYIGGHSEIIYSLLKMGGSDKRSIKFLSYLFNFAPGIKIPKYPLLIKSIFEFNLVNNLLVSVIKNCGGYEFVDKIYYLNSKWRGEKLSDAYTMPDVKKHIDDSQFND